MEDIELLTPNDVCAALQVTKDWLYDAVQAGHFPVQRLPGSRLLRFRKADIAAMLKEHYQDAAPLPAEVSGSRPP